MADKIKALKIHHPVRARIVTVDRYFWGSKWGSQPRPRPQLFWLISISTLISIKLYWIEFEINNPSNNNHEVFFLFLIYFLKSRYYSFFVVFSLNITVTNILETSNRGLAILDHDIETIFLAFGEYWDCGLKSRIQNIPRLFSNFRLQI